LTGFSTAIGAGFKTWLMAIILGFKGFLTGLALIYLINDTRKSKGYKKGLAWCAAGVGVLVYYVTFGLTSDAIKEASSVSITQKKDPKTLNGKVVALRKEGEATIKRLRIVSEDLMLGMPDNPDFMHETVVLRGEEINNAIMGKVVWWWGLQK